jgi:glycosyltransferase involved in cell wall biosynthesis
MKSARLYGRILGHGSLSVVTSGFASALKRAGILAGIYGIDAEGIEALESIDGSDAYHGIYTGPLESVGKMFERGRHKEHWVMLAPNSNLLPKDLITRIARYQREHTLHLMAPSHWAAGVVEDIIGKCLVVPHGVSPEYQPNLEHADECRRLYMEGSFRVLHFSTSARERKGTIELLKAWEILETRCRTGGALLCCVMDYPAKAALEDAIADGALDDWPSIKETVRLVDRAELAPEHMARTLQRAHAVCQPSRGEGFGLIPLEAICCGVPIVATAVTGHSEYLHPGPPGCLPTPGVVIVLSGSDAPIDDLPGSIAPSLDPVAVADALEYARKHWLRLQKGALENASLWQSNWLWEQALDPFIRVLQK